MRQHRKQTIPNKLYFRIGEVSDIVGVKPYVLRYWETEFGDVRPTKSKSGQRLYKRRDVELLMQVKTLLYEERYTIDGAKQRLRETARGDVPMVGAAPAPVATPQPAALAETDFVDDELIDEEEQLSLPTEAAAEAQHGNGHAVATIAEAIANPTPVRTPVPEAAASPAAMAMGGRRVRESLASRRLLLKLRDGLQEILEDLRR